MTIVQKRGCKIIHFQAKEIAKLNSFGPYCYFEISKQLRAPQPLRRKSPSKSTPCWKVLQKDKWFTTNPIIGNQMKSYSDIEKRVVNYKV